MTLCHVELPRIRRNGCSSGKSTAPLGSIFNLEDIMQERFTVVRQEIGLFGAVIRWLLKAIVAGVRALDRSWFPVSEWKWVGSGGVLYRRVTEQRGFSFIGELVVDRQTVGAYLGTFGDAFREDAVPVGDGRFFYPASSESSRVSELVRAGCPLSDARSLARRAVIEDMNRAASYGETWFIYGLVVSAKRGSRVLAEVSLWGIDAVPHVDRMDPRVESLYQEIIPEAEREALDELKNLSSYAMRA